MHQMKREKDDSKIEVLQEITKTEVDYYYAVYYDDKCILKKLYKFLTKTLVSHVFEASSRLF